MKLNDFRQANGLEPLVIPRWRWMLLHYKTVTGSQACYRSSRRMRLRYALSIIRLELTR